MSDGYSFTQEQIDAAKGAGFSDPRQQAEYERQQQIVADARRRGDDCEARVLSGAAKPGEIPEAERRARSGVETMVSGRGLTPWHQLPGTVVLPGLLDSKTALRESGLDWLVRMLDVQVADPAWRDPSDKVPARAIVRESDRRVLGAAGPTYTPVQNETLFEIGDGLTQAGARWETAGSLYGGRQVWALMRLTDEDVGTEVQPGDPVKTYLLLRNNHDGRRSAEVMLTNFRPVCRNSHRLALQDAAGLLFRYRHTTNVNKRLEAGATILEAANHAHQTFIESAKKLSMTTYPTDEQQRFLATQLGIELDGKGEPETPQGRKKLARAKLGLEAERAIAEGLGASPDTAWVAFNAVTRFTSHDEKAVRGGEERRLSEMLDGAIETVNARAFDAALALAEARA